jgi:long-chain acyl-CoA synthetase
MFLLGGRIGFYNGNISKIKDDFDVLKPTFITSVPRLYNKFAEVIKTNIENETGLLTNKAVAYKLRKLKENG